MTSSMNINKILKIARAKRAHLLQRPLHYFSASYASAMMRNHLVRTPCAIIQILKLISQANAQYFPISKNN